MRLVSALIFICTLVGCYGINTSIHVELLAPPIFKPFSDLADLIDKDEPTPKVTK